MTERELIQKAQNGESEAFGELYDQYVNRIYRFVFIKVASRPNAEDLTHQIFLAAWQNIQNFQFQGFPFSSWLYKIAANTVIDFYRTRKQEESIEFIAEDALSEFPEFAKKIDEAAEIKTVKNALQKLEPDQQTVLIMKFVDEFSNKEIAEILGKSEGAVRVTQHRALKRLKNFLQNNNEPRLDSKT